MSTGAGLSTGGVAPATQTPTVRRDINMTDGLGPIIRGEYPPDPVYDLCRQAIAAKKPLLGLRLAHPRTAKHVGRAALQAMPGSGRAALSKA